MKKLGELINVSMPANFQSYLKVKQAWNDCAGETLAFLTTVTSLKDSVLNVAVHDQVWLSEIGFLKGELISRLNQNGIDINNINFYYKQRQSANKSNIPPVNRKEMSDKERKFADKLIATVDDERLRASFKNAIYAYFTVYTLDDYLNC